MVGFFPASESHHFSPSPLHSPSCCCLQPVTTGTTAPLTEILGHFEHFTGLPVVDGEGHCVGIVSDMDVARCQKGALARSAAEVTVGDVMSAPAIVIVQHSPVAYAAGLMLKHKVHRLPVVDDHGVVVGICPHIALIDRHHSMDEANGSGDAAAPIESLACLRCSKPARLQCPKCLELKLPRTNASFCSQECFKASWADHKVLHKVPPAGEGAGAGAVAVVAAGAGEGDEVAPFLQQGWLYVLRKGQTRAAKMPPFDWTGPLRPFPVAPRRPVPAHIPRPDWADTGRPEEEPNSQWQNSVEHCHITPLRPPPPCAHMCRPLLGCLVTGCCPFSVLSTPLSSHSLAHTALLPKVNVRRLVCVPVPVCVPVCAPMCMQIKSPEQIARMRHTCKVAREVLDVAAAMIRPGVTTDEIDRAVHDATIKAGGYPSPLNYYFFPKSCCTYVLPLTSVNEVVCHGIPDCRKLEDGDIVNVDVTVYLNGCHGDLNETFFVGTPSDASVHLVRTTMECLDKAIAMVKPGVRFREVGEVISRHAAQAGLSVVRTYCGHGIGELFHCAPNIPHYASE
ncbi:unnamed protein product [Closterium sp. Naga37s-1]|nr:unnamed protein product [Closterium sp. Naga37s-1]